MFFKENYQVLDDKIDRLHQDISAIYNVISYGSDNSWEAVFELMDEIQNDFKSVRYPTKSARQNAWENFCEARNDAYSKKRSRLQSLSRDHKGELLDMLGLLDYSPLIDGLEIALYKEIEEKKQEMIERGRQVNKAAKHFKSVKHEMTREHKDAVHERIVDIRESHNLFWEHYYGRKAELQEEQEEKSTEARQRVDDRIEANEEKLEKAESALIKLKSHIDQLEDLIEGAWNDDFRERQEGYLDEAEAKKDDIEAYIKKLKIWIDEDRDRLRNWN